MERIDIKGAFSRDPLTNADIHCSTINRVRPTTTHAPAHYVKLGALTEHAIFRNLHQVQWYAEVDGGRLYDGTFLSLGWFSSDETDGRRESGEGHGQALYVQQLPGGVKEIDTCVFVAGFAPETVKLYAAEPDKANNLKMRRSIVYGKVCLVGGIQHGARGIIIDDCAFLACRLDLGYLAANGDVSIRNSLIVRSGSPAVNIGNGNQRDTAAASWQDVTFTGNTVSSDHLLIKVNFGTSESKARWHIDRNAYYSTNPTPFNWNGKPLTFAEWQALGFDANSTFTLGQPDAPIVRVYRVPEVGAANVAVWNPAALERIPLPGHASRALVRAVRNWDEPTECSELMMTNPVAPLAGWADEPTVSPLLANVSPRLEVFRIEKEMVSMDKYDEAIRLIQEAKTEHAAVVAERESLHAGLQSAADALATAKAAVDALLTPKAGDDVPDALP